MLQNVLKWCKRSQNINEVYAKFVKNTKNCFKMTIIVLNYRTQIVHNA